MLINVNCVSAFLFYGIAMILDRKGKGVCISQGGMMKGIAVPFKIGSVTKMVLI